MTDADLARWEELVATIADDMGLYAPLVRDMGAAIPSLIAEVRRLRCELHLLHGMTNEHGRALFPAEETLTP